MDIRERIELLARRINELSQQQSVISAQLLDMKEELKELKRQAAITETQQPVQAPTKPVKTIEYSEPINPPSQKPAPAPPQRVRQGSKSSFEEFVGKNLASKVGILVTIAGIFFGVRYSIEHNLVSPVVRIISGYISGLTLIVLAIILRKKYESYSSALMGGGLAVMYFITYTAYSFYGLVPQLNAFILMVLFTAATVYASLEYNRELIAHLGLVGAYAVPFLLSDNSGRYLVFFSYIAIINAGILLLAFRKYWKSLFYAAFVLTWTIYTAWHLSSYDDEHFTLAFIFRSIFFVSFYITFLAYKLVKKEKYGIDAVMVLLSNSFIFYAFGYYSLGYDDDSAGNKGLFTIINAAVHFGVSQLVRPRLADKALYYLVFGLTIVFITIAIPVQFDGNWVTLLWTAEAVLMFYIGRMQSVAAYEKASLVLLLLGLISLGEDWVNYADRFEHAGSSIKAFANIVFATGLLVAAGAGSILYLARNKKYVTALPEGNMFRNYFPHAVTIIFLLVAYLAFYLEILVYFSNIKEPNVDANFLWQVSEKTGFRNVVLLLYSMVFTSIVIWVNQRWVRSREMNTALLAAIGLLVLVLLVSGLPLMNALSKNYYIKDKGELLFGTFNITIRYIVAAVMALLLLQGRDMARAFGEKGWTTKCWQLIIHGTVLAMLSAEYLRWTGISGNGDQYKLGLSILWGVYALYLIVWGIHKKQKYLRLAAIALFIITLVKLFIYDLDEAGTVTKTISFISLGVILLLVSYLYNRYKDLLFGNDE